MSGASPPQSFAKVAPGDGQIRAQVLLHDLTRGKRHLGDSNPCGQSPMDFESISLAARTKCLDATQESE